MKRVQESISWFIAISLPFVVLFFLPSVQDYYDTGKQYALYILTIIISCYWTVTQTKKISRPYITISSTFFGFLALFVASLLSVITSPNRIEALISPYGPLTFATCTILSLIIPSLTTETVRKHSKWILYTCVSVLALISLYQFFGLGKSMFPSISFLADPMWTPTGYSASTLLILLATIPLLIEELYRSLKAKHETYIALSIVMTLTVITGLAIVLFQFIPTFSSIMLPIQEGWAITLGVLKIPKYMVFGIGTENFLHAYNIGKSAAYAVSPIWNIRFTASATTFFHILTSYGLLGLVGFSLFLRSFFVQTTRRSFAISRWIIAVSFLLLPPSIATFTYAMIILILSQEYQAKIHAVPIPRVAPIRIGIPIIVAIISIAASYAGYRVIAAEMIFYQSLQAAKANNGTQTYNLQVKSIQQNKFISKYHIVYSQTNLALAVSLTNMIGQPDNKETEEQKKKDQQLVAQLIQQSIREAKIATTLNDTNVLAWENLARVYNQLIDIAQGADTWTITSYKKAIELDPNNPILSMELGSVFLKKKQYTDAITHFQKAIAMKQNYANAYYNLANAYTASGDIPNALSALKMTQSLVSPTSADYEKVSKDIDVLTNP